jgi:F-type H+-transporting ATPase subunit b
MLIDWFTVGAQALNFAILVGLLSHFLYRPVLDAIAAREKKIADELADADRQKAAAQKDRDDFQHRNETFDAERGALLAKATAGAAAQGKTLLDAARQAADALSEKRRLALQAQARDLSGTLGRRTQDEVFAVARKALADMASASLEGALCTAFVQRLRALGGPQREAFAAALKASDHGARVRSALVLPEAQRTLVRLAVDETFQLQATLLFEAAPDLVGGIEIDAHGCKVAWSLREYLGAMERAVADLVAPATAAAAAPAKPAPPPHADEAAAAVPSPP